MLKDGAIIVAKFGYLYKRTEIKTAIPEYFYPQTCKLAMSAICAQLQ